MNNQKMIHETAIRTVLDAVDGILKSDFIKGFVPNKNSRSFRSISSASSNLTLVFPVLTSRNVAKENAAMNSKAYERKCVTMLQILFSALSVSNAEDGIEYIKQFHTNLKLGGPSLNVDTFMNTMDKLVKEGVITVTDQEMYDLVKEDMQNLSYYLPDTISKSEALYNYRISKDMNTYTESVFLEAPYNPDNYNVDTDNLDDRLSRPDIMDKYQDPNDPNHSYSTTTRNPYKDRTDIMFKTATMNQKEKQFQYTAQQKEDEFEYRKSQDASRTSFDKDKFDYQKSQDANRNSFDREKFSHQKSQDNIRNASDREKTDMQRQRQSLDMQKMGMDNLRNQLMDNDIKKCNELVPTMMIVNYISKGDNGQPIYAQSVIGVKAKIYPISSEDIISRLAIKHKDKNLLLNFIKSTTREISFFRDFLLCIDRARLDALSQSRKGSSSKLWKVLERRGMKSRFKRKIGANNDASAITLLTVTQEEVEYLKKTQNIDIEDPKVIRPIMEAYNLMGVSILDEINEVAKYIFDSGNDIYEEMSFTQLDREEKNNDYKKVINLMTKMR